MIDSRLDIVFDRFKILFDLIELK